ncbi:MAG: ParA family protein [bacterium]
MEKPDVRALLQAGLRRFRGARDEGHAPGDRQARVVAIAARKGGVGKTTTAVNLAAALVEAGQSVFLADLDPQGHVASALREVARTGPVTLSEVLLADRPRDVLDAAVQSGLPGLWLTPPDKGLGDAEARLTGRVGRETILQAAMGTARTHYDTILLDCPPMLGNLTLNALLAADSVLVPCDMSILALEGVADLLELVVTVRERLRHPLEVLGVLRTRVDGRNKSLNDEVGQALADNFGDLLLDTVIPVNSALAAAQSAGQSIFAFRPRSSGAEAYRALAVEVGRRAG